MHRFEVWAPVATRVDVEAGAGLHRLQAEGRGWWGAAVEAAGPGDDYRFVLDGGEPVADPRSHWQPEGVEGPSRIVDHDSFAWTDAAWRGVHLPAAVLYELHVGTFSAPGTFEGAIAHLDHLADLGVDLVELMPVAQFPGARGWGYDGVFTWAPQSTYGGPDGLKRLVDACHGRGLGVVLDVVMNHMGPSGNVLPRFGPYFTDRYRTPWGKALNFDGADSGPVRRYFVDACRHWLEHYHLDGLRLDAVHAIVDQSAVHLLEELTGDVAELERRVGRPLWVVGECDLNDPRYVRPPALGGYGLDAHWVDEVHHAVHAVVTGDRSGYYEDFGTMAQIATALERGYVYAGEWSPHRRRPHGRPPVGVDPASFVTFLQNHDQVGNRAMGERLGALASVGRCQIGSALVLLAPFVPLIFMGEEWSASTPFLYFTDHQDAELGRAVTEGRTHEFCAFGWVPGDVPDPQDPATFQRSVLDWDEVHDADGGHLDRLAWYRALIRLRRRLTGPARCHWSEEHGWVTMRRGDTVVAANLGQTAVGLPVDAAAVIVLASRDGVQLESTTLVLPADSVAVVAPAPD